MSQESFADPADRIVTKVLSRQAERFANKLFLRDEADTSLTYGEADVLADRHAQAYRSLGVEGGSRVAILMDNSTDLALTTFGINRAGGIWSTISPEYRGEWLTELLTLVQSDVLVVDADLLSHLQGLELPFKHVVVRGALDGPVPAGAALHDLASFNEFAAVRPDIQQHFGDVTSILWTSGTTGRSKGVMQPNNTWITYSLRHNTFYRDEVREGEGFYGCTPMYNAGGWIANIYPALVSGASASIDSRFSASNFWNRLRHYDANHSMVLGAMTMYLAQQPERDDDFDNPLRTVIMNPPFPSMIEVFQKRFGVEHIAAGFGQSEIMGATVYRSDMPLKPGSSGFIRDDDVVETKLMDENDFEVPSGQVGEICVRPKEPYVIFSGYFGQPEETAATFRNLWHHTGDLGRFDEDGELFFVDRKKDSTRHKGRNISSFEVEHIVRQYPGLSQFAVYGVKVPHLEFEEELMIAVVPVTGTPFDPLELCKFIDSKAPYFFVPRYVEVMDTLPATPTNKIQKFKLRERGLTASTWDLAAQAEWRPTR